jgi:acylpyruvate hydrolase
VRLATLITTSGSRLHVRADDGGYVDIGEATGEDRFARFGSFVAAGPSAMETARGLRDREGREFAPWEFGPAVPAPDRILCLGLNYAEHALEGGRCAASPAPFSRSTTAASVRPARTCSWS